MTASPGTISVTLALRLMIAPASSAAFASANDTLPIPPWTYPHAPGLPSMVPIECIA